MSSKKSLEDYMHVEGDDEAAAALNFPPTEILRKSTDKYVEADQEKIYTFLYPCDVPRRDYQFQISQLCFKYNTLVCLPTGSGKTFIAAVVIMNFYRWYPNSIIIFCATTRALVEQQIDACNMFTTIPDSDTIALLGTTHSNIRKDLWKTYRVVYATPQTVQNDIKKGRLDPCRISLIIFDEAHHARHRHAYSMITRMVAERNSQFRIIGLSATPGKDIESIQSVVYNLMISKIIYKDSNDPDIKQYQHNTDIEIITVKAGGDEDALTKLMDQSIAYIATPLQKAGFLNVSDVHFLSRGAVYANMEKFKSGPRSGLFFKYMNHFSLLLSLTSMKEKLQKYGPTFLDKALKEFDKKKQTAERKSLMSYPPFISLIKMTSNAKNTSHPKLVKLTLILEDYFAKNSESRCIVFTNFRDVAKDLESHIKQIPNVKCSVFTGKAVTNTDEGLNEKVQQAIVGLFRKGNINLIIATCVAEEGLDIGEVDLIICYDTQSSPLRTVQRMGRTGRKRAGHVIFLMTEGIEEKALNRAVNKSNDIKNLLTNNLSRFNLYNPPIPVLPIPDDIHCIKLLCAKQKSDTHQILKKESKNPLLDEVEVIEMNAMFKKPNKYRQIKLDLSKSLLGATVRGKLFGHSRATNILNGFAKNMKEEIPESIDEEVSKLFGVKNSQSQENDESDSESSEGIVSLAVRMTQKTFLSDSSADKEQENFKFLSDSSDMSDDEIEKLINEAEKDLENQNKEIPQQQQQSFLSDEPDSFADAQIRESKSWLSDSDEDETQNNSIEQVRNSFLSDSD